MFSKEEVLLGSIAISLVFFGAGIAYQFICNGKKEGSFLSLREYIVLLLTISLEVIPIAFFRRDRIAIIGTIVIIVITALFLMFFFKCKKKKCKNKQ